MKSLFLFSLHFPFLSKWEEFDDQRSEKYTITQVSSQEIGFNWIFTLIGSLLMKADPSLCKRTGAAAQPVKQKQKNSREAMRSNFFQAYKLYIS